jgi:hypothetical protein
MLNVTPSLPLQYPAVNRTVLTLYIDKLTRKNIPDEPVFGNNYHIPEHLFKGKMNMRYRHNKR